MRIVRIEDDGDQRLDMKVSLLVYILIKFLGRENGGKGIEVFFRVQIILLRIARYVGKIISIFVRPRLPADEVIALFFGNGKLAVLAVRRKLRRLRDLAFFVEDKLYLLWLIGLIKADIFRHRFGINIRQIFSLARVIIDALFVFKVRMLAHVRLNGEKFVFDDANARIRLVVINVFIKTHIIVVQNIYVHQISLDDPLPLAHGEQLDIAAVIQSEHLRAVGIVPTAFIPKQRISFLDGKLHFHILRQVEVVRIADSSLTADIVARKLDKKIFLYARITDVIIAVVLFALGSGLERDIIVFIRRGYLLP